MDTALTTALILLVLLQVKHMFADFFLQTPRMLSGRDEYIHIGRMQHVAIHGALSVPAFLIIGAPLVFTVVLIIVEVVVHYHIDWGKGRHSATTQHGPADAGYWRAFGLDQLLHQLTYVAMVWIWAGVAG